MAGAVWPIGRSLIGIQLLRFKQKLPGSFELLEPIPIYLLNWTRPRICKPQLRQGVFHSTKVTRRTCDHDVVQAVTTTSSVRQDMIELHPHGLERRVLRPVRPPPCHGLRIETHSALTNSLVHEGDSTK
jgi:hypothetical protein